MRLIDKHLNLNNKYPEIYRNKIRVGQSLTSNPATIIASFNNKKLNAFYETRLEELIHMELMEEFYSRLGICKISLKVKHGILEERPKAEINDALKSLLREQDLGYEELLVTVNQA
ncbi:Hypothetical predicted protein [Octopus vulgaris]|uniref:Uncharacterized protein n=1 Tax=Octopus vulgaris TaxID=6645 RepID=A0AA36BMG4_OCTVU|nr:Hypothetical predicted protein [Octopus vulgaris]